MWKFLVKKALVKIGTEILLSGAEAVVSELRDRKDNPVSQTDVDNIRSARNKPEMAVE